MLADRLCRRFATAGRLHVFFAAACGAVALGAAAYAESGALTWLPVAGAALAGGTMWRLRSGQRPSDAIEPASDPDGLVRALLSAGESYPYADRLESEAAAVEVRFRRRPELHVFSGIAVLALVAAAWAGSAPAVRVPEGARRGGVGSDDAGSASMGRRPGELAGNPTSEPASDPGSERAPDRPRDGHGGTPGFPARDGGATGRAMGEWQALPRRDGPAETGFRSGRDQASLRPWIQRYYELKLSAALTTDPFKTGLFLVGARGAIATTVLHGLEGLRTGMPPIGLLTERPEFRDMPWANLHSIEVHGWDVTGDAHSRADELARAGVLPHDLVDLCGDLRDRLEMSLAPGIPDLRDAKDADRASRERAQLPAVEAVQALRRDLREWRTKNGLQRGVVVYLATVERGRELPAEWDDESADPLELLQRAPANLSRSLIYGVAAVAEGIPFVNFTPAPGPAAAALQGMARRKGVPVLGNDGKTGETLLKTVLAPMFRDRALNVLAWEGYNMLGNRDGAALIEDDRKQSKIRNKDQVLPAILGNDKAHTGVHIDFVPSLNDWKTAWDFVHFEGFLGTRMSLQFTWQGSDSALAAPLVLDLARIALLAQDRGEGGPLVAAAPFFKNPVGVAEHDFHRQMDALRGWLSA